jgi:hypothetical protein
MHRGTVAKIPFKGGELRVELEAFGGETPLVNDAFDDMTAELFQVLSRTLRIASMVVDFSMEQIAEEA